MKVKLRRMSGLGNDFLIYDARTQNKLSEIIKNISNLSSRKNKETKGCDQFIIMKSAENADVFMEIYNADGSEVSACGNATRCIGFLISEEISQKIVQIQTKADNLISENLGNNLVSVNMGKPIFEWNKIPLSENFDVFNIPISVEGFEVPSAVSMGNPHLVFFTNVINIDNFEVKKFGEPLESHNFFPQKTNVEFAKIIDRKNIRMRVFERGVGETLACGTGACATAVIANKKGLVDNDVNIIMNGGILNIKYPNTNGDVMMIGEVKDEGSLEVDL